jgi:plasmid maintenance system antidote protein VapI
MDEQTLSISTLAEITTIDAERLDAMIQGKEPFTLQAVKRLYIALNMDAKTVLEHV